MSFGNPKRDFERRFDDLRGRKFGRVVRGPYAQQLGLTFDPPGAGNPTTGQTWLVDVLIIGQDRVVKSVPLASINNLSQYANTEQVVALETIKGRLTVTGRAEFDLDQGETLCFDDEGVQTQTLGLGTACRPFTFIELSTKVVGGFGNSSFQPTLCIDVTGAEEVLG